MPGEWAWDGWWRVTYSGRLWCETTNVEEARRALATVPGGAGTLQRREQRTEQRWVDA